MPALRLCNDGGAGGAGAHEADRFHQLWSPVRGSRAGVHPRSFNPLEDKSEDAEFLFVILTVIVRHESGMCCFTEDLFSTDSEEAN